MAPAPPDLDSRLTLALEREDRLGVLSSTLPVVRGSGRVRLDAEALVRFARGQARLAAPVNAEDALHCTFLPPRRFLNYLLVLEALNFSFWDDEPRWRVPYHGASHDGYWALAAALHRAIREDGLPLWDARFLADLTAPRLARLLRGEGQPPPLMAERLAHLREVGDVLLRDFGGAFANLLAPCAGDAVTFVLRVVECFPSFRDEALWQGRPVRFYKRAQICASDLARLLKDEPLARLAGLEQLTAFADYKVPQVLRREGILVPDAELAARIDRREPIPAGSAEEIELRAATVWGCEWVARAIGALRAADGAPTAGGALGSARPLVTAAEVDHRLWSAGQRKEGLRPYHRARSIYY